MRDKIIRAVCVLLIPLFVLSVSAVGDLQLLTELDSVYDGILSLRIAECGEADAAGWINNGLADSAGGAAEWYAIALSQGNNKYDFTKYADALEKYISENKVTSAATRQHIALALLRCGRSNSSFIEKTMNDSIRKQGIMSLVFGLHLLNNGCESDAYTADFVADMLLSMQLSDGGWALTGAYSDVDITAMVASSLVPRAEEREDIRKAIDDAVSCLSEKQLDNGGFMSYGVENSESTGQVIIALCSIGIDPGTDSRFTKNGMTPIDAMLKFRLADGSFSHIESGDTSSIATAQVFSALTALRRYTDGKAPLYVFEEDATEGIAETEEIIRNEADELTETESEAEAPETESETEAPASPEAVGDSTVGMSNTDTDTDADNVGEVADVSNPAEKRAEYGYKLYVSIAIAGAAAILCVIMLIRGKRSIKTYIFILGVSALLIIIVFFVDIQTAQDYYTADKGVSDNSETVTLTIRCDTILDKASDRTVYQPEDGIILPKTEFPLGEGESVYDILIRAAREYGIHTDITATCYVAGINNLYEFDFGELSGWMYYVNGEALSVGCGEYKPSDGDLIEWLYTCELGKDLENSIYSEIP